MLLRGSALKNATITTPRTDTDSDTRMIGIGAIRIRLKGTAKRDSNKKRGKKPK